MADKSTQLLLDALSRAAGDPTGLPLYAGKFTPGLFTPTAAARQAAQRCKDEGLLTVLRTEARGKTVQEVCAITEKGFARLLRETGPRQVLEDMVRALEAREAQFGELVAAARQAQASLEALRGVAVTVLQQLAAPPGNWVAAVLEHLERRQTSPASEDCPLPELYQAARQVCPALTIGQFHDGLRRLHDEGRVYLHPWTGPLYDLPDPACALLVGHEVAYYASLR